jgi:amino acid adenylation domain-containing protein
VSSHRGEEVSFRLSANLHEKLLEVAQEQGATLFMVLQAGLAALLMRMGSGTDIVLGSLIAGRNDDALNDLVGFFVNTLVLRTDTSGNPSFEELVGRVREDDLNAYAHQELPFEHLVEVLNPERSPNQHPLFQVMLVLQNNAPSELELTGLKTNLEWSGEAPAVFDLTFNVREDRRGGEAQGIHGRINYAVDLFDRGTVEKLAQRLERILEAAGEDPSRRIGEIEILGEEERRQIVEEWNATKHEVPNATLPDLFEAQVEKTPDRTAVVHEHQRLTYGGLNRRANRLAHYLRTLGIGPDSRVGICVERSPEMIAAAFAVLKAGGAYVPLDPEFPLERVRWMVEDGALAALLLDPMSKQRFREICTSVPVIDVTNVATWEDQPENNLSRAEVGLTAEHSVYVIYTSGSTGRPKGVMVTQAAVGNFLSSMQREIGCDADDTLMAITTWSFDIAGLEVYWPLTRGACVKLLRREEGRDGARLLEGLQNGVTMMQATPANWRILVEAGWKGTAGLKALCGGEALDADLASSLVSKSASTWNMYGPTETTIWSLIHKLGETRARVAIGRPIGNTQVYILNEQGQPVPAGVGGEVYICGAGLARGYLKRPELTAERFVPNPFGEPGSRMYCTGDLGCWRRDGVVEYLGRNDFQVKIRGFRIEPEEIEAVLRSRESVAQAVVVARETSEGQKQLVGYVVARAGEQIDAAALRRNVAEKLPDYMVPAAIMVLAELPLSPSGKLDRKALPAPEFSSVAKSTRAPRTPEEEILAGLFAEVLHLERVGIDDNFFEVGGHSLLAMRLISRLRTTLGVELGIRTLFEEPTIAGLALRLSGAHSTKRPLQPHSRSTFIPLSFAQKRLWFLQQMDGPSPAYNMPVAIRLEGALNRGALRKALNDVLGRHEILRTVFCQDSEGPQQRILDLEEVPEFFFERQIGGEDVELVLNQTATYGFDLEREIPLRVWLLRLEEQQHVLLVLLHHIATDGWSMAPLGRDLSVAYNARCHGEEPRWIALPVQYADYSLWQAERLGEQSDEHSSVSRQLRYWREKLSELPPEMDLPRDRMRPAVSSHSGGGLHFRLSASLHKKLLEVARELGATLFMVLQAGLAALLTRLGAGTDIVLGSPIAGRNDDALNDLVGFFVNTLVLRTDTSGNPNFEELVGRVREDDLNAYAHQELPFEHLVEMLNPERSLNRHPLFQVMLLLQNNARPELELIGLKVRPEWSEAAPAIFDLTFNLREDRRGGEAHGIQGQINYAADLFDRGTVEKLAERLERVLEAVGEDPSQRIGEMEILGDEERRQIVEEWNATKHEVPHATMPELFEAQVEKTPHRTAVVYEGELLTYGELNRRANKLAHYLLELGVGPDTKVAICVERSLEMMEALLGVLKAGGLYIPLDPGYPMERLRYMLEDSEPIAVVTQPHLRELFSGRTATVPVIEVGNGGRAWSDRSENNPLRSATGLSSQHLAYMIYTSGSTGMPKGAMNEHRGVVNRLVWMQRAYGLNADDAVLQKTPFSFDVSVWELFWPLFVGARLVMAQPEGHKDPTYLAETIQQANVTTMHFVPSMLEVFLRQAYPERCSTLVRVVCSGEALSSTVARRFKEKLSSCALHNLYGPTEAAVDVTAWTCPSTIEKDKIPIGRPIANTSIYILDGRGEPVPVGVVGQIYIGGVQVARGYLNRPELTAEKFLPDPIAAEVGVRMYGTGDLGKWRPDGNIEFLGRNDQQIKIRGFRIELGEIEAALTKHAKLGEAVVLARESTPGDTRLVVYYTVRGDIEPDDIVAEDLRRYLTAKLPEYMVPAAYMRLEGLPLTPNGKLDRKKLPAPGAPAYAVPAFESPQGEVETALASIWAELLKVQRVGRRDNFFDLGGHSLLIIQLASRLRSAFGVEVPVRAFFDAPTLLEMTHTIAVSQIEDENSEEILQEIRELSQMSPDQVKNLLEPLRNSTQ